MGQRASYDGQTTARTLRIDIQRGYAGIMQVATDVLSLTKVNCNRWRDRDQGDCAWLAHSF